MKNAKLFVLALVLAAVALTAMQANADKPQTSIIGTVLSRDGEKMTLRTEKGDIIFEVDKDTAMPAGMDLAIGSRITVWYDQDEKLTDTIDARKIEALPAETKVTTPPPATPPPSTPVETQTRTEVQTQTTTEEQLPHTASPLPLMGLTGALALVGGAFVLRRSRRA